MASGGPDWVRRILVTVEVDLVPVLEQTKAKLVSIDQGTTGTALMPHRSLGSGSFEVAASTILGKDAFASYTVLEDSILAAVGFYIGAAWDAICSADVEISFETTRAGGNRIVPRFSTTKAAASSYINSSRDFLPIPLLIRKGRVIYAHGSVNNTTGTAQDYELVAFLFLAPLTALVGYNIE